MHARSRACLPVAATPVVFAYNHSGKSCLSVPRRHPLNRFIGRDPPKRWAPCHDSPNEVLKGWSVAVNKQTPRKTAAVAAAQVRPTAAAVPVIEETLRVAKALVDLGGVRVSKKVQRHEVVVDEELQSERVDIERRPIGTRIEGSELPATRYEGATLIVPVIEEVVVTEKRFVLVEEVRITVVRSTHRDPQRVTLQKEEIVVERLGPEGQAPAQI